VQIVICAWFGPEQWRIVGQPFLVVLRIGLQAELLDFRGCVAIEASCGNRFSLWRFGREGDVLTSDEPYPIVVQLATWLANVYGLLRICTNVPVPVVIDAEGTVEALLLQANVCLD
jgi:hypothetical protein